MALLACGTGCGGFAARRMAQAPNTYPQWLAPKAPVMLTFSDKILTVFTNQYLEVNSPEARIRYRMIEPADYEFRWTNRLDARGGLELDFSASVDRLASRTNRWTQHPRGTVVLLHGYGVAGFAMLPWAFLLGQEGWRCVLVDLRGHGKSTGRRVNFGPQEARDIAALLDQLHEEHGVQFPVSVVGHSFGAVLALRLKKTDPRIDRVVAISPYADLGRAVRNVCHEYAPWLPDWFVNGGLRKLPGLLQASSEELNPGQWMAPEKGVLFVAGGADRITPPGPGGGAASAQRAPERTGDGRECDA